MPSPNSLANLKPFPRGHKLSPGRPAVDKEFKQLCQAFMDEPSVGGFALLVGMARDSENPNQFHALKLFTEYAYGKPMQPVTVEGGGVTVNQTNVNVLTQSFSLEELRLMLAEARRKQE